MFDTLHQLMTHTGVHPANKYKCDECGWYFSFIHALTIHGRDCHDSRHHACQWCPDYFSNPEGLLLHIRSKHNFECTSCFVTFPSVDELKEHEVAKHGGAQLSEEEQLLQRCREQKLKAQQDEERQKKAREEAATQEKYFGCTNCLKGFSSQKDLDDHTTKEHVFICGVCYRIFLASGERDRHMVESHKKKEKLVSGQDKLLVDEWQKRMARKEKDRQAQQDWDEAWEAYVIDKSKKETEKKKAQENEKKRLRRLRVTTRMKTKIIILLKMQAMPAAKTLPMSQARRSSKDLTGKEISELIIIFSFQMKLTNTCTHSFVDVNPFSYSTDSLFFSTIESFY